MTREQVRNFISAGVTAVGQYPFGSGRISEFNSKSDKTYPTCWLETLQISLELTVSGLSVDNWQINLHIAKLDKEDSTAEQYEAIIDECDLIAQKLINKYNNEIAGYKTATIDGTSRTPFIKKHADCLTGVLLSFTLSIPDTTNVCS